MICSYVDAVWVIVRVSVYFTVHSDLSTVQVTVESWHKSTKLPYLCLLESMHEINRLSQHHFAQFLEYKTMLNAKLYSKFDMHMLLPLSAGTVKPE